MLYCTRTHNVLKQVLLLEDLIPASGRCVRPAMSVLVLYPAWE